MLSLIETCKQTFVVARVSCYVLSKLCNSQTGYWRSTVSPLNRFPSPRMQRFPLYSLYHSQPHTWNCDDSQKAVTALPQKEFANNRLLREFRNLSVKPRWRPVVEHRQNVGKPSFRKLTMEMPVKVTPRTAFSNFVRVRCEFFGQFRRLVQTKIRPSSIVMRLQCWGPALYFELPNSGWTAEIILFF